MEKISIVIPVWRETGLERLTRNFKAEPGVEIIVAMAQGDEITCVPEGVKVTISEKGRGTQMNLGAQAASGQILLFLHADTCLPHCALRSAREIINRPGVSIGAFRLKTDSQTLWLRLVCAFANLRSRLLKMPYGDQALFIRRETFNTIGGYRTTPILEDVLLVKMARRHGRLALAPEYAVTSARRWVERGLLATTLRNTGIILLYLCGFSPERLSRMFRR